MATSSPGHEKRDVNAKAVALLGLALLLGTVLALAVAAWFFRYLAAREAGRQPQPPSLARGSGPGGPPEPRLQTTPVEDLRAHREAEDRVLGSYGWVDRDGKVVRVPIERAIEIVVEREGTR